MPRPFQPRPLTLQYEFNDSDRECALDNLKIFLEGGELPWDALTFITGEVSFRDQSAHVPGNRGCKYLVVKLCTKKYVKFNHMVYEYMLYSVHVCFNNNFNNAHLL